MSGAAVFRRIFDYLDLPIELADPATPRRLADPRGALRFEGVAMAYSGTGPPWTVEDLDFEIRPGQMVALVGPSGAGKTTVTYLATRLYDPTRGRVAFDGVDLRELALDDLARWTAMVTQETHCSMPRSPRTWPTAIPAPRGRNSSARARWRR